MIVLHASFPIDPARRDDALELFADLVEQSQQEDGMVEYQATTDVRDPNTVRFFEWYENEDAFDAHTQTDHFQDFEEQLPEFLAGEPDVMRFEVSEATELEL
ncbi:MAG: putative quinol monooxygenase [Halobacterium sp.]